MHLEYQQFLATIDPVQSTTQLFAKTYMHNPNLDRVYRLSQKTRITVSKNRHEEYKQTKRNTNAQ